MHDFGVGQILGGLAMVMVAHRMWTGWQAYRHRKAREKALAERR